MSLAFTGYAFFRKRLIPFPIVTYISHLVLTGEWKSPLVPGRVVADAGVRHVADGSP